MKVRECAIGRSYNDCEGDAREERACKEDQVTLILMLITLMMMIMLMVMTMKTGKILTFASSVPIMEPLDPME